MAAQSRSILHEDVRRGSSMAPGIEVCGAGTPARVQLTRRCLTCCAVRPPTRITLLRLLRPAAILTEERGTFKRFEKKSMQASLALPSRGGAVRETFSTSPISPAMAFFLARG